MNEGVMKEVVLEATNVTRAFRQGPIDLTVLQGVNINVRAGERIAIIGASGSGKTTLLQILGGLDRPTAGIVKIAGSDIHSLDEKPRGELRNRTLGFIYQFHHLLPEFSALENVAMPLLVRRTPRHEAEQAARAILERVGLGARLIHRPHELSGGERQRAAVARALVTNPRIVLADEPTGNLDFETGKQIMGVLENLHKTKNQTIVMVTHDRTIARQADRILVLRDGKLEAAKNET